MRDSFCFLNLWLCSLLSVLLSLRYANASLSLEISYEDLLKKTTAIAVVTAKQSKAVWQQEAVGKHLVTHTQAQVLAVIAGPLKENSRISLQTQGGCQEHVAQYVSGEAQLLVDQPYLVFLSRLPASAQLYILVARSQGCYPIDPDLDKVIPSPNTDTLLPLPCIHRDTTDLLQRPHAFAIAAGRALPTSSLVSCFPAQRTLANRKLSQMIPKLQADWKGFHARS